MHFIIDCSIISLLYNNYITNSIINKLLYPLHDN